MLSYITIIAINSFCAIVNYFIFFETKNTTSLIIAIFLSIVVIFASIITSPEDFKY